MSWIALKMLTGDRGKYFAILFGVTFAAFLIAEQSATFCGIMLRTVSQIHDVHGADIWVMNSNVRYVDDLKAIKTSLTGLNTERVDTRVVQLIYAIDPNSRLVREGKILVGQLLDVFIDTRPTDENETTPVGK